MGIICDRCGFNFSQEKELIRQNDGEGQPQKQTRFELGELVYEHLCEACCDNIRKLILIDSLKKLEQEKVQGMREHLRYFLKNKLVVLVKKPKRKAKPKTQTSKKRVRK